MDTVYIPLPNSLHCQWVIKALEAGKPVLCEKPLAMNDEEVREIMAVSVRTGIFVMEAFAYLHDPLTARLHELIDYSVLGRLSYLEANFCYFLEDKSNARLQRDISGGATYDLGCYSISFFRNLQVQSRWGFQLRDAWAQSPMLMRTYTCVWFSLTMLWRPATSRFSRIGTPKISSSVNMFSCKLAPFLIAENRKNSLLTPIPLDGLWKSFPPAPAIPCRWSR